MISRTLVPLPCCGMLLRAQQSCLLTFQLEVELRLQRLARMIRGPIFLKASSPEEEWLLTWRGSKRARACWAVIELHRCSNEYQPKSRASRGATQSWERVTGSWVQCASCQSCDSNRPCC
jgi:hypothetical protein